MDVVFLIVHDTPGEDGSSQGILRVANLPFVGSDALASAACMDKDIIKCLLHDAGLNIVPFITLTRANRHNISFAEMESKLGLPLFVKLANQDFSVGASKVASEERYTIAVDPVFRFDYKMIVGQGIKGRKIECTVFGNGSPRTNTCGETVLTSDFYVYDTKCIDEDGAKVVVPATITPEINDKIRATATQAYQTLGCTGMACVDVFLTPENEVAINEVNTLPGFTNISMHPKLWQVGGPGYTNLITRLIGLALERYAADNTLETIM